MTDPPPAARPGPPVTLITGGSTGIGAATARMLLELHHQFDIVDSELGEFRAARPIGNTPAAVVAASAVVAAGRPAGPRACG